MKLEKVSEDARGWIYVVKFPYRQTATREAILIYTRKGMVRGGEYHHSLQHDVLLTGSLKWTFRDDLHTWVEIHSTPATHEIQVGVAHLAEALEDTLYVEWLDGPFEKTYIPEMRVLVDRALKG